MKDLIFEIINKGFMISFIRESGMIVVDINNGYQGEKMVLLEDFSDDHIERSIRTQVAKLEERVK